MFSKKKTLTKLLPSEPSNLVYVNEKTFDNDIFYMVEKVMRKAI